MGKGRTPWKPTGNIHIDAATIPLSVVKKLGYKVRHLRRNVKRDPDLMWEASSIVKRSVIEYLENSNQEGGE